MTTLPTAAVPADDAGLAWRARVCIVGELPPPSGGMAVQAERLGANLRSEGHAVLHLRANARRSDAPWSRVRGLRGLVNLLRFLGAMFVTLPRVDVVHVFSHSYLSFFLFSAPPVVCARVLGRRVVIHYHGGAAATFFDHWGWLALPFMRLGHVLIVPSGYLVDVFAGHGLSASAVPNTLPLETFRFAPRQPLLPRVLMARHLTPDYNPACGVRAFARLARRWSEATLTVAGDGPLRAELEALCAELAIRERVQFLGNVGNERMREHFEAAHIFLNSSRVDNQPVSILEALACGLPVVSTAVGGIPFMVSHGESALLAPDGDDATLAAHMARLLDEPALARRLAACGRRQVEGFNWPTVYPLLAAIYGGAPRP